MAGTARRWVLPYALPAILFAAFSEWGLPSFVSPAAGPDLWQCPCCTWIQQMAKGIPPPLCAGTAEKRHSTVETTMLQGEGHSASEGPPRFLEE